MSMSLTSCENDNETAPKKRRRNEEKFRRNVIRTSKVRGVEHINWKGHLIPSRSTGAACKCKLQCFTNFSDDEKSEFVANLNQLKSKDEQDIFLQQLIEKHAIKHRRPLNSLEQVDRRVCFCQSSPRMFFVDHHRVCFLSIIYSYFFVDN